MVERFLSSDNLTDLEELNGEFAEDVLFVELSFDKLLCCCEEDEDMISTVQGLVLRSIDMLRDCVKKYDVFLDCLRENVIVDVDEL